MRRPHPFLRTVVVVLLSAWYLASDVPQLAQFWHAYGSNPYISSSFDASRDWRSVSIADRANFITLGAVAAPGVRIVVPGHIGVKDDAIALDAPPLRWTTYDATVTALSYLGTVLLVLVSGWLLLYRPSPITWAFFVFGPFWGPADWTFSFSLLPPALAVLQSFVFTFIAGAAMWGLVYFGLTFPSGAINPLKRVLARWSWIAWPIVTFVWSWWWGCFALFGTPQPLSAFRFFSILVGLMFLASVVALGHTFVVSHGLDRQRIKWIFASYALGILPLWLLWWTFALGISIPVWVSDLGFLMTIFLPFAVAYTVIVHRVLDVNFIISRAVVYGVLTSLIVGVFALLDWFVGTVLAQTRLAVVVEICAAIGLGFGLNGLHARLDRFVDATLFRDRHRAERRLSRVANAVAHAANTDAVDAMLVEEPADALHLASAALFRADAQGAFRRTASVHWRPEDLEEFGRDDRLLALLRSEQGPLVVDETGWNHAALPHGPARPILAVPIVSRHDVRAFALYGAHLSGEAIDPDEVRSIEKIASMASAAIDHLEAMELRRQMDAMARQLSAYRSESV